MIKNIVFDIGNVLLKYDPQSVVVKNFPNEIDSLSLTTKIFKSQIWYDLNLGKITEEEAIGLYVQSLNIEKNKIAKVMHDIKHSLVPINGSIELLDNFFNRGFSIFSITDNVKEIVQFLRTKYDFFQKFKGIIVSAEVGFLKPDEKIYRCLLEKYNLKPKETVFIDDVIQNINGVTKIGIHGIHFTDIESCKLALKNLNLLD